MTDEVDDFLVRMIRDFQDKPFRSAAGEDLGIEETEEEKESFEKAKEESKDMLSKMNDMLGGRVKEVRVSQRLKNNPVCLTVDGDVSLEMERVMNSMPIQEKVESQKVLEINPNHSVFNTLTETFKAGNEEKLRIFASLLYDQAALIGGLPVEDPVAFSNHICDLMK